MQAAQYETFGGPIAIVDVPEPDPPPDGIVVRIEATGVCRSDWHGWKGHDPAVTLPQIPGHEYSGTVVAVGPAAGDLRIGQRVAVPFILACGSCDRCLANAPQVCRAQLQPGFGLPGSFAEYVAVPRAHNVVPLPDGVGFDAAAALGCRYTTAWRALIERARVAEDEWVIVFGAGGVGLAAVQIGTAFGARIVAVDPDAGARDRATATGAVAALPFAAGIADELAELTGGGAAVTIDAIGKADVVAAALAALAPTGRHVQVGILEPPGTVAIPMNSLMGRELTLFGSHGMAPGGFPRLIELIATGRLDPAALVTRRVDLTDGVAHLTQMDTHSDGIVLIEAFR